MRLSIQELLRSVEERPADDRVGARVAHAFVVRGEPERALDCLRHAVEYAPPERRGAYLHKMAGLLCGTDMTEAVRLYERAVDVTPRLGTAWVDLARIYRVRFGRNDLAASRIAAGIRAVPDCLEVLVEAFTLYLTDGGNCADVVRHVELKTGLSAAEPMRTRALATALENVGRYAEALVYWRDLEDGPAANASAISGVARCYERLGELDNAIEGNRRAFRAAPDEPDALLGLVLSLMRRGDLQEASHLFQQFDLRRPVYGSPRWDGVNVEGRSFHIAAALGYGDMIQFVRLIPLLRSMGAREIVLESMRSQRELFASVSGVDRALVYYDEPVHADCHDSLQQIFHKMAHWVADARMSAPYLSVSQARLDEWRRIIADDDTIKVGIVWCSGAWASCDPYTAKNVPLDLLAAGLSSINGVSYYALQRGVGRDELQCNSHSATLIDVSEQAHDLASTAAALQRLNLLVTVDTSLAHLAGALGRPAAVLLPYHPDWRWAGLSDRTDWYSSLRLFRQPRPGDWQTVVAQVKEAIADLARQMTS